MWNIFKITNKSTRRRHWRYIFAPCSNFSSVNFEQVNVSWEVDVIARCIWEILSEFLIFCNFFTRLQANEIIAKHEERGKYLQYRTRQREITFNRSFLFETKYDKNFLLLTNRLIQFNYSLNFHHHIFIKLSILPKKGSSNEFFLKIETSRMLTSFLLFFVDILLSRELEYLKRRHVK